MKKFKKIMAVLVAAMMIMATMVPAFAAVTIEISRDDSTYEGQAASDSRIIKWYRVFTASYGNSFAGNSEEDGGYDSDGNTTLLDGDDTNPVAYVASPTVAAKLGSVNATTHAWTTIAGNKWFDLTYVQGTEKYNVRVRKNNGVSALADAAAVQEAAQWLFDNSVYDATGDVTWDASTETWKASGLEKGYYVISSDAGKNLIAATSNIKIKEKNAYPPIVKTQADEDNTTFNTAKGNAAIEDVINYNVSVTIPKTAKVGDKILVWDIASSGLTYNDNVTVKSGTNTQSAKVEAATGDDIVTDAAWTQVIEVTNANQLGTEIVFTFSMTVDTDVLTDELRENKAGLKYGRTAYTYESVPEKVYFTTYFTGIKKIDKDDDHVLPGVTFTLKEKVGNSDPVDYKVTLHADGYYYPDDAGGSASVVTDENGLIKIRGLDDDKTYSLTETATLDGYYVLEEPVDLTLVEDLPATYSLADSFNAQTTYYTKSGSTYTETAVADTTAFESGTYYTKDNASDTYAAYTAWEEVENEAGNILPATGGMGTTVLYIVGGMLVILAGAYLFFSRKRTA